MRRRDRNPAQRLRYAVEALPRRTREAMLRGITSNRIIVGAYVDRASGGICPMLAAHRNGGRTNLASFARAWDRYTGGKRPRPATRRELRTLRALLESSVTEAGVAPTGWIADAAARIRAERAKAAGQPDPARAGPPATRTPPVPDRITVRRVAPAEPEPRDEPIVHGDERRGAEVS
jgi:hypothetical protein